MIDLHMHTVHSDGTDLVKDILCKANSNKIEVISITDHNSCEAYKEMDTFIVSEIYRGNIIVGCEFTTSLSNRIIEVLGYGFDVEMVSNFFKEYYDSECLKERNVYLGEKLIKIFRDKGFYFDLDNCLVNKDDYSYYDVSKTYKEIVGHKQNEELFGEDIFGSVHEFRRKGMYNPFSEYYLGYDKFFPSLKETLDLIHKAGGIAFLAHPYQYEFENFEDVLNKIYEENNIDGVECFHTTFSREQSEYLVDFAKNRKLLISGGSDYHGLNKKQHELGVGRGNLNVSKNILDNWNIRFYK